MFDLLASEPRIYLQVLLAWVVCPAALIWGGGPERAVAATWLIVFEVWQRVLSYVIDVRFQLLSVDLWLVSGDFVAGFIWIAVALYANRNYTLMIAAMQLLAMTAHVARGLIESIAPVAYVTMVAAPGWIQLFLLAVGLIRHVQRKGQFGEYRDWRITRSTAKLAFAADAVPSADDQTPGKQPSWRDDLK